MSRLAIKTFCARVLADVDAPIPCEVFLQRPKSTTFGEDQAAIIIAIPETEERQVTLGAVNAYREVVHSVRIDIYWAAADEDSGGARFDVLLETIDQQFRQALNPTIYLKVSDPETGKESQITKVGTEIRTAVDGPILDETLEGLAVFEAHKVVSVTEYVQS